MSINSMANSALARRPDMAPLGEIPKTLEEIAEASRTPPTVVTPASPPPPAKAPAPVDSALAVIFGYIPTEIVTLYVAVLAAVQQEGIVTAAEWGTFWFFLIATPIVYWLVFAGKLKSVKKPLPLKVRTWPVWEMCAATLAFTVWAFALPESPFTAYSWYSSALSAVAVLLVSTILGLLAPLFQRPLGV